MSRSQNGWPAAPNLPIRPLVFAGESFSPGVLDDDDVHDVFMWLVEQLHTRVEPVVAAGWHVADDWGFSYRENRNDPNSLSNHSSGTAIDYNATRHPNGVPASETFTAAQIAEIHKILAECGDVIRWGGDYTGTPDAMHFEINTDKPTLAWVAERIRDDMFTDKDRAMLERIDRKLDRNQKATVKLIAGLREKVKGGRVETREVLSDLDRIEAALVEDDGGQA